MHANHRQTTEHPASTKIRLTYSTADCNLAIHVCLEKLAHILTFAMPC